MCEWKAFHGRGGTIDFPPISGVLVGGPQGHLIRAAWLGDTAALPAMPSQGLPVPIAFFGGVLRAGEVA